MRRAGLRAVASSSPTAALTRLIGGGPRRHIPASWVPEPNNRAARPTIHHFCSPKYGADHSCRLSAQCEFHAKCSSAAAADYMLNPRAKRVSIATSHERHSQSRRHRTDVCTLRVNTAEVRNARRQQKLAFSMSAVLARVSCARRKGKRPRGATKSKALTR